MKGMDPSLDQPTLIKTLEDACEWAELPGDVKTQLFRALGGPSKFRDIVFIPIWKFDAVTQGPVPVLGDEPLTQCLTIINAERSRFLTIILCRNALTLRNICHLARQP